MHQAVNVHELLLLLDGLIQEEKLPRDVKITWLWYDPRIAAMSMILWSEMFDIIPEGEYAPYIETV
jgi:hypothetical protein